MSRVQSLGVTPEAIAAFCRPRHIRKFALFGSVLRGDFGPESDVDVLVEYEPGRVPGFDFFTHQEELAGMLGRKVDLHTPNSLSKYFREEVLREAEVLCVEA